MGQVMARLSSPHEHGATGPVRAGFGSL